MKESRRLSFSSARLKRSSRTPALASRSRSFRTWSTMKLVFCRWKQRRLRLRRKMVDVSWLRLSHAGASLTPSSSAWRLAAAQSRPVQDRLGRILNTALRGVVGNVRSNDILSTNRAVDDGPVSATQPGSMRLTWASTSLTYASRRPICLNRTSTQRLRVCRPSVNVRRLMSVLVVKRRPRSSALRLIVKRLSWCRKSTKNAEIYPR